MLPDTVRGVIRRLAVNGKKTIKRSVVDIVEALCSEQEFAGFRKFLKERGIKIEE